MYTETAPIQTKQVIPLTTLYSTYWKPLCRFAEKLLNDEYLAEDVVADIFVKYWNRNNQFEHENQVKAFLYISTRNAALNMLQAADRLRNKQKELYHYADKFEWHVYCGQGDHAYDFEKVRHAMKDVSRRSQQVIDMLYFQNMSCADIAKSLGLSYNTVKNQRNNALKALRRQLADRRA